METGIRLMELQKEEQTGLIKALRNGFSSQQNVNLTPSCAKAPLLKKSLSSVALCTASDITLLAAQLGMNLEDSQFAVKSSTYQMSANHMVMPTLYDLEQV